MAVLLLYIRYMREARFWLQCCALGHVHAFCLARRPKNRHYVVKRIRKHATRIKRCSSSRITYKVHKIAQNKPFQARYFEGKNGRRLVIDLHAYLGGATNTNHPVEHTSPSWGGHGRAEILHSPFVSRCTTPNDAAEGIILYRRPTDRRVEHAPAPYKRATHLVYHHRLP